MIFFSYFDAWRVVGGPLGKLSTKFFQIILYFNHLSKRFGRYLFILMIIGIIIYYLLIYSPIFFFQLVLVCMVSVPCCWVLLAPERGHSRPDSRYSSPNQTSRLDSRYSYPNKTKNNRTIAHVYGTAANQTKCSHPNSKYC